MNMKLIIRPGDMIDMVLKSRIPAGSPSRARVVRVTPQYVSVKIHNAPPVARLHLLSDRIGEVIRTTDYTVQSRAKW